MTALKPLPTDALYRRCDPKQFKFKTTAELDDLQRVLGQDRAVASVRFAIGVKSVGYNLFAFGPPGTGRHTIIHQFLSQAAADDEVPADWVYINNFTDSHKPRAIEMPPGRAAPLGRAMERMVEDLRAAIPAAFEGEEYRTRRQMIEDEFKKLNEQALEKVNEDAEARSISLMRTPTGLVFAPVVNKEVLTPDQFNELPERERKRIGDYIQELQDRLQQTLQQIPIRDKECRERIRELDKEVANLAVGHFIDTLRRIYEDLPEILEFLDEVQQDVVENVPTFRHSSSQVEGVLPDAAPEQAPSGAQVQADPFRRYHVNVVVDNSKTEGAPVVYEDNPTLSNLLGRIEHTAQYGTLVTDFNLIKPGALHRANGGYLILDARKVLMQPMAWEELKRTLRSGEIGIESLAQIMSVVSTVSLEPERIPLDVKIVLIGEPSIYYLLCAHDPEFPALFKVLADFGDRMDMTQENSDLYIRLLATMARNESLRPIDRAGVARIIEHSARLADDTEKLSTHFRSLVDLLCEANYWSGESGNKSIGAADVQKAIDAKIFRSDRVREQLQEAIERGTILIDAEGERVGQVNGLSVLQLGHFSFGRPSRITARVRVGKGEVVDIERQVELGGPLHSKGVLILSGFLGARFAAEKPLALAASLVFEQSYGGVDGDSASSAELYTLLSALAEAPIKQSFAVTGSVNQHGEVQAIGGANEKIEGFFDVCKASGLNGEQGVLIPASNVKHLMLRRDVVEAVDRGEFSVYAVETIDQGIELLTGLPAGERGADGQYPEGTINRRVEDRLEKFAQAARAFAKGDEAKKDAKGKDAT